jgi:hemoglobin
MRSFRTWTSPLLASCLFAAAAGPARSDEKAAAPPAGDKSTDAIIFQTLKDVINKGADLYNPPTSDYAGCWRLYEGALITVRPFLASRPELQDNITKGLAAAYNEPYVANRAFVLRKVIDDVRTALNPRVGTAPAPRPDRAATQFTAPAPGTAPGPSPLGKTLWDRLGGEANVKRVVDDFVATAVPDPAVNFLRDGKYKPDGPALAALKRHLVEFISLATGGPLEYTGKDMKTVHQGMGISNAGFDAAAGHLKRALEKNGVRPEDVRDVMAAVGGTRRDIVETSPAPKSPDTGTPKPPGGAETLWDRLGGEKNVARVIDDLFATAGSDPTVNFFRQANYRPTAEEVATLKAKVRDFISSATGGPYKYTGKDMKSAHQRLRITDAEFTAFADHLKKALEKNGASPDDVKTVMIAAEGTRKDIVEKPAEK